MGRFRMAASALSMAWVMVAAAADYVASGSGPYLREGPGSGYDAVRRLETREPVYIREKDGNWVRVRTGKGDTGWVRESEIRRTW